MEVIRTLSDWNALSTSPGYAGKHIGLVPTMGYLHQGHLSLVRAARAKSDRVVVTIFVNPTQFVPGEDLASYPRDEIRDIALLDDEGADCVFIPSAEEIYPVGFSTGVNPPAQSEGWCGASRPGHFPGVCTVVSILFNIIKPDTAYFGRKDAQQTAVIRQMVKDLHIPVQIGVCPTIRGEDGLAMSSRNTYLSPEERQRALVLYRTLSLGLTHFRKDENLADAILEEGRLQIEEEPGVRLDYLGVVDRNTFKSIETIHEKHYYIGAIYVGKARLIDNIVFTHLNAKSKSP